jgi:hypothetical protein
MIRQTRRKNLLPRISQTEREALEAGSVPDFRGLLAEP